MPTKNQRKTVNKQKRAVPARRSASTRSYSNRPVERQATIEEIRARHEKKQKKKKRHRRMCRTVIVMILLIIALVCVVFLTPFFLIDHVAVEGNHQVKESEIRTVAAIDKGQNTFSLNTNRIQKRIEKIPYVKTARIIRKLPKGIMIDIAERSVYFYIKSGDIYYAVDKDGIVLETPTQLDAHYICVDGIEVNSGKIGEKISLKNEKQFEAFVAVLGAAKSQKIADQLSQFNVTDPENIVFVYGGRITVNFGDIEEAERKMMYLAAVGNSEQRRGSVRFDMDAGKTYFSAE